VAEPEQARRCPSCRQTKAAGEFYAGCTECKGCKKDRSRRNRADQARKIAAFERFVDVLIILADRSGEPPAERKQRAVT
jgi:hypothetical protein